MTSASLLLIVKRVGDISFYALLLVALIAATCRIRPAGIGFTELLRKYWPIHLAMAGQLIAVLINQAVNHDFYSRVFDLPSRLALFPALLWAALLVPYKGLRYVRWAFVSGSFFAIIKMGIITDWGAVRDFAEFLSIIAFAEMAMLLGFFSLLSLAWAESKSMHWIAGALKLAAGAAGIYIAYLSQTRGAWISIPGLMLIAIFVLRGSRRSLRHQLTWFIAATILLGCLFLTSHTVRDRLLLVKSETADYIAGKSRDTSVGIRIQLWQGSWHLFTEHPFIGIGVNNFKTGMKELARRGVITEEASTFPHSHNELLYNLTTLGLIGLIGILALYVMPLRYFAANLDRNDNEARSIAGMGIALCFGFFSFGLVDVMFMWRPSDNFYVIMMALLFACSIRQKQGQAAHAASSASQQQLVPSSPASLVPQELLKKSDKILFIAHLAIGDYTYLQNCFKAFNKAYPHIAIHLWIDELRRTGEASAWPSLRNYSLYDWVAESSCFSKVYRETYSPELYERSVGEAQAEHYPIVVSLSVVHHHRYVLLARRISANGFIVAQRKRGPLLNIRKHLIYRKLDTHIAAYKPGKVDEHISAIYAGWFERMFALSIPEEQRAPSMDIPQKWVEYANEQFLEWGFDTRNDENHPVIFLNSFAKSLDRSWPLDRLFELIRAMRRQPAWRNAAFIINAVPEEFSHARDVLADQHLDSVALFSANENFFQLPAIIAKCSLVISVETGVMHLANAVRVPVVALMRQKNPEWAPFDVTSSTVIKVSDADDWVDKIMVEQVLQELVRVGKHP
jgi:heptosyltransferase-3